MITFKLFQNKKKVEGDNQPSYRNETISYRKEEATGKEIKHFEENVTFEKGKKYQVALYKNDDGSLGVKIEENTYVNPNDEVVEKPKSDIPF